MTITTTYKDPDMDGYGCAVAYAELLSAQGNEAVPAIWGTPQLEVRWVLKEIGAEVVGPAESTANAEVILLDCSDLKDCPGGITPGQVIEIIDHRKVNQADQFQNAKVQIELIGAAATLVAERFQEAGITPSKDTALMLYAGIISNTQNFTGVADERDRKMGEWLSQLSGASDDFAERMFEGKSDLSGEKLREVMILDKKSWPCPGGKTLSSSQIEVLHTEELVKSREQDIRNILQEIKDIDGGDCAFVNLKDLETGKGIIICDDETRALFDGLDSVDWKDGLGRSEKYTLRKQITPWLKEKIDSAHKIR